MLHRNKAIGVELVGLLASGLGGKRAGHSLERDIGGLCVLLKMQALPEHFSSSLSN